MDSKSTLPTSFSPSNSTPPASFKALVSANCDSEGVKLQVDPQLDGESVVSPQADPQPDCFWGHAHKVEHNHVSDNLFGSKYQIAKYLRHGGEGWL